MSTSAGAQEARFVAGGVGAMKFVWTGARLFLQNQEFPLSYKIKDPPKNDIPKTEAPKKEYSHEFSKDVPEGKMPLCVRTTVAKIILVRMYIFLASTFRLFIYWSTTAQ